MGKRRRYICLTWLSACLFACSIGTALASMATALEEKPAYSAKTDVSETSLIQRHVQSKDRLSANSIAGVAVGIDSNPLLDSTHKADGYVQENLRMGFRYPIGDFKYGQMVSNFGFDLMNVNYYKLTGVNIFDSTVYANLEQELFGRFAVSAGYGFESFIFPNDRRGTFLINELNTSIKQRFTSRLYQKVAYRMIFRDYTVRRARLTNGCTGTKLRHDFRNLIEHEFGAYPTDITKLKLVNQVLFNDSNDRYEDFYDYFNYRLVASAVQYFNPRLYMNTGFYYQKKNYDSRTGSDDVVTEKDNQIGVSTSLLYDITRSLSVFVNYSHIRNMSNDPTERYTDNLC